MEYISGIVERITYENEETGFSVIKIKSKGFSELVTVVGNLAAVNVGASIKLKGKWRHDSKYGRQFNVVEYKETVPATIAGIEKYLGSGLIKGIGPVYARRIVNYFKEDTLQVIEEEPDRLINVDGIGQKRVDMIKKAWEEQKEIKNVMLFLQSNGVSTAYAVKIYKTYGNQSINIVKNNPFRLADDIWGIGFKTADKIARQLGFDKNSYERCRSGIIYVLNELSNDGHCYATREQLISEAVKILELEEELIESTINRMTEEKSVMPDENNAIYLPPFYYSEIGTQKRIQEILARKTDGTLINIDKLVSEIEQEYNIKYNDIQLEAIKTSAVSKLMVLTGGPGTGKTTTTLAIIKVFQKMGKKVLLAAPTGRAAKRMSETTGMEAKTIHRLLEYKPPEGYQKNADNLLECDALIIDETSMVDIILMYNLLKAINGEEIIISVLCQQEGGPQNTDILTVIRFNLEPLPAKKDDLEQDQQDVRALVEAFGKTLQKVSLSAPKDVVGTSIEENYSGYVTPELLQKWQADPQSAPGHVVSSPWPDRIDILRMEIVDKNQYTVYGEIIEITSVELVNGGAAAKRPALFLFCFL
jgi:exodeoxyribonuclease V alpha subunit